MDKPKRERIDWHRVTFWGSIGVATVFILFSQFSGQRRLVTIFEAEGRHQLKNYVRYNHPAFAEKMGWDGR